MTDQPQIVGYYCNHEDEPYGARTHLRDHADFDRPKKKPFGSPAPDTTKSLTFGVYDYKTRTYSPPPCPRALPLIAVTAEVSS